MKAVDMFEATSRLGQLLDQERSQRAAQRIREMRKGVTLGGSSVRDIIDKGRSETSELPVKAR